MSITTRKCVHFDAEDVINKLNLQVSDTPRKFIFLNENFLMAVKGIEAAIKNKVKLLLNIFE